MRCNPLPRLFSVSSLHRVSRAPVPASHKCQNACPLRPVDPEVNRCQTRVKWQRRMDHHPCHRQETFPPTESALVAGRWRGGRYRVLHKHGCVSAVNEHYTSCNKDWVLLLYSSAQIISIACRTRCTLARSCFARFSQDVKNLEHANECHSHSRPPSPFVNNPARALVEARASRLQLSMPNSR